MLKPQTGVIRWANVDNRHKIQIQTAEMVNANVCPMNDWCSNFCFLPIWLKSDFYLSYRIETLPLWSTLAQRPWPKMPYIFQRNANNQWTYVDPIHDLGLWEPYWILYRNFGPPITALCLMLLILNVANILFHCAYCYSDRRYDAVSSYYHSMQG